MNLNRYLYLCFFILCLLSCQSQDNKKEIELKTEKKFFSILFSHNINGETHPCGCRKFPLGGLPQVAGLIESIKEESYPFYVDSGDALFPNSVLPDAYAESLRFGGENIVEAFNKLGLQIFVPGDYDFAQGIEIFNSIVKKKQFPILISNLAKDSSIDAIKKVEVKINNRSFVFFGFTSPELIKSPLDSNFESSLENLKKIIDKENGKVIILISHAGFQADKKIATQIPKIDWIIGAHTQSFLQEAEVVGKTQIGQVLSRNHYLGEIRFDLSNMKVKYFMHEVGDELSKKIKNNPFVAFIEDHKKKLEEIQTKEQEKFYAHKTTGPAPTAISCLECHKKQTKFWYSTSHSLAYMTLKQAKEDKNRNCIGCHSLNFEKDNGFFTHDQIIKFSQKTDAKTYWKEFQDSIYTKESVRLLSSQKRSELSQKWVKLDSKSKVTHNFANVQCLNCHNQNSEHPFDMKEKKLDSLNMQNQCLSCHTRDQSPEWYKMSTQGFPGELDGQVYLQMLKKVSCPKGE